MEDAKPQLSDNCSCGAPPESFFLRVRTAGFGFIPRRIYFA
jgi:hypothetical protein